jgi:hypothetical protein
MNMNARCCVLSCDLLHDMRTYTALTLSQCYDSVHRTDLTSSANLTIATRQARLGVSHSKLVNHVSSY